MCTISSIQRKGLYKLQNKQGEELQTYFTSIRLKIYFHDVQSKFVRVDLPPQERDMILNKKRLDDMIIN